MKNKIAIEELAEAVAVPREAYEKAEKRYKSLGEWFDSDEAESAKYSPHIYPQGSFRLQTAIRPLTEDGDYDLDLGSRLRTGITKGSMSQKDLKELIGRDLKTYRNSKGIKAPLEAKHRCWRLQYADGMSFHMDIVPSIPVTENRRGLLKEAMHFSKTETALAEKVAQLAGNITDDTKASYPVISNDWLISNSEGYALWFEEMSEHPLASVQKEARAQVDALPKRSRVTALHKSVMLLKAHRDQLFSDNPEAKPVSVIIPSVRILTPHINPSHKYHMYRDGRLCLYKPSEQPWYRNDYLHEKIIPWTAEWLLFYEIYLRTDRWEGPEASHTSETKIPQLRPN